MSEVEFFDRVMDVLLRRQQGCKWASLPPCSEEGCECWTRALIATELANWLAAEPRNARRLAAMFAVAKAAKAAKMLYFSDSWLTGHKASYQYHDKGELAQALKHLSDLEQDLGSAYQSILDGRM